MQFTEGSYPKLNEFVEMLRGMQKQEDFDCLIGVSGFKGFGKSTFSIQTSRRYVKKYKKEKFSVGEYTAYTNEDVFKKVDELESYSPLSCDEAVNFAMGEDWNKAENKRLKKLFTKIRTKHLIFFFNIPDLWWLDKKYRENMMTIWIHITKKGHVMLALPNLAPAIEDRWNRDWLIKAFKKQHWNFFSDMEKMMKILRRYPCYYDEFTFPKLPERMYQEHLRLREERMLDDINEPIDKRDKILYAPFWNFKNKPDVIMKKMLEKTNIKSSVRKKILDALKSNGKVLTNNEIVELIYREPVDNQLVISAETARRWNIKLNQAVNTKHKTQSL